MDDLQIECYFCKKNLFRRPGWINENKKLGQKNCCSLKCLAESRRIRVRLKCENPLCKKRFERTLSGVSPHNYCSHRCAMIINNSKFPKRVAKIKQCAYCGKEFKFCEKYCSRECKDRGNTLSEERIISWIKEFYEVNERIPVKREYKHYHAARGRFGTWNDAIKAAGFEPNPIMFARKYVAKDGHKCDSLAERIIDDWLFRRNIKHERAIPYPGNGGLSADFKVADFWIEFFGLSGEVRKYDRLKRKKFRLAKRNKLNLIRIYPKHLFPRGKLDQVLGALLN